MSSQELGVVKMPPVDRNFEAAIIVGGSPLPYDSKVFVGRQIKYKQGEWGVEAGGQVGINGDMDFHLGPTYRPGDGAVEVTVGGWLRA